MQRLNVLGVSDKERITAMRKMGGVKVLTVSERSEKALRKTSYS